MAGPPTARPGHTPAIDDRPPLLRSPHARASHDIPESELPAWLVDTTRQLNPGARAATPTGDVRTVHAARRARRVDTGALDLRHLPVARPSTRRAARPFPWARCRPHGEWLIFTAGEALPYSCTVAVVVVLARLLGFFS